MRILVTGARGFIGRHVVAALRKRGDYVGEMDLMYDEEGDWDGIVHLAAVSRVSDAEKCPIDCVEANVMLTASIIERNFDWLILASTNEPPSNIYGLTKRFAEDYAALMARRHRFRLKVVRFDTVYGPGDHLGKLIPGVRNGSSVREGALPVTAIHVNDAVSEILDAIRHIQSRVVVETEEELRRVAHSYP